VRLLQREVSKLVVILVLPIVTPGQSPSAIGELFASETTAQGPVLLAGTGMSVVSGSQLSAGKSVATLRLERGGEVRICPNGSITVSAPQSYGSKSNQELMIAMDAASVELNYPLNDLADTVITPDFKLMLAGPGVFHFALGVNHQGDTCLKPMAGNSASIIVSEMIGSSVYQVKPDEAVLFAGGKLAGRGPLLTACGCATPVPVLRAQEKKEAPPRPAQERSEARTTAPADVTAPAPPQSPDALHVQVEAPLIFRGDQPVQPGGKGAIEPVYIEPVYQVARIKFSKLPNTLLAQDNSKPIVLKPGKEEVSGKNKEKKGFFGRIKGFFAALFHK
jgi:hypothetical protein